MRALEGDKAMLVGDSLSQLCVGVVAIVVVGVSVGVCTRLFRSVRAAKSELVRSACFVQSTRQ